jgi:hypothetical protein
MIDLQHCPYLLALGFHQVIRDLALSARAVYTYSPVRLYSSTLFFRHEKGRVVSARHKRIILGDEYFYIVSKSSGIQHSITQLERTPTNFRKGFNHRRLKLNRESTHPSIHQCATSLSCVALFFVCRIFFLCLYICNLGCLGCQPAIWRLHKCYAWGNLTS